MKMEEAKKRIAHLTQVLNEHNYKYYVLVRPEISDFDFDMMLKELAELEQEFPDLANSNSPTKRVGGDLTDKFKKVKHRYPMMSLSNTYSIDEIKEWENRVKKLVDEKLEYTLELKYDGVAISLSYDDGKLVQALTRGDGEIGEEMTWNVMTVKTIT